MSLKVLRGHVDFIDTSILRLLEQRMLVASKIGEIKKEKGLPLEDLSREKEVLDEILSKSDGYGPRIVRVFRQIIEECKGVQE